MKTISQKDMIQHYVQKYHIESLFEHEHEPFSLKKYEKGELILQPAIPNDQFYFVVAGCIHIYSIHDDGSVSTLSIDDHLILLGDLEYVNHMSAPYFVEAQSEVMTLCLPMHEKYKNDNQFLRFLLHSLSQKLIQASHFQVDYRTLEEKVMAHMTYHCPDQILSHIEITAMTLHCSKRQLLRILASLCQQNKIIKIKKGTYQLL